MEIRRFQEPDAAEVSSLIIKTMQISNSKDYSPEEIAELTAKFTPDDVLLRSRWMHLYVVCTDEKIIGCGGIGPYWGSETESALFNIFVLPEFQGKGVGRKLIETLEADEYALRAKRIEIAASITARDFYLKLGYTFKNGIDALDDEQLYRLEKFRSI